MFGLKPRSNSPIGSQIARTLGWVAASISILLIMAGFWLFLSSANFQGDDGLAGAIVGLMAIIGGIVFGIIASLILVFQHHRYERKQSYSKLTFYFFVAAAVITLWYLWIQINQ